MNHQDSKTSRVLSRNRKPSIDVGLAVLGALRRKGETFTQSDIADVCECSQGAIYFLEKIALRKVRKLLRAELGMNYEQFEAEGRQHL